MADVAALAAWLPAVLAGNWSALALQDLLESDHLLWVLVVAEEGAIAGFAECQQILDEGHLLNIAISPHWQRQGLGGVLLNGVLSELGGRSCMRCLLEVRRSNTPARQLYEHAGFSLDGIRKAYYPPGRDVNQREDALLYSLSLSPEPFLNK